MPDRPLRRRVWSAGRLLILLTALGITFGTFFLAATRVATRAREVEVPDLHGRSVEEATAALAGAGLSVRIDPVRRPDPSVPAGHVLGQDPDAGTVLRRQRAVRVRISDGQRDPEIPVVTGQAERAAEIALLQDGIEIRSRAEIRSSAYGTGSVVGQDPPGRARGAAVTLLINRGEAALGFVMPDLIGTLGVRSVQVLRARGFRVTITAEVAYPGLPPGIVVRQTPPPGYKIALEEPIQVEISR